MVSECGVSSRTSDFHCANAGPVPPSSHRYGGGRASCDSPEQLTKPLRQRISQNLFERSIRHVAVGLLATPGRPAKKDPVGRAVTGSPESLRIHECFQVINRMPVQPLPVLGDTRRHAAQNMRGQMLDTNPRQNQKATLIAQQSDVAPPRFRAPPDEPAAAGHAAPPRTPPPPPARQTQRP